MRDIHGRTDGPPPPVDLAHEKRVGDFVRKLIRSGVATAVHDVSDGGLAVALAEMAMASGIGATIPGLAGTDPIPVFFGEDQGRYVVTLNLDPQGEEILAVWDEAKTLGIHAPWIGTTGGAELKLGECACDTGSRTEGRPRIVVSALHGRQVGGDFLMAMDAHEIEKLIKEGIPDAKVTIRDLAGDGDHYAAEVVAESFRGKSRVQQHQMVYDALKGNMGGVLHALAPADQRAGLTACPRSAISSKAW